MIGRADLKNRPAVLTWDQLNRLMVNVGQSEFNYDSFKMAYDSDPVIQALTKRFDKNGIELTTKKSKVDTAPSDAEADRASVSQAAKRATNAALNK